MKSNLPDVKPELSAQALRLDALRRYAVLDTEPEQALDDLTTLAATICEAPIALISLVDQDRQWFKSRFGVEMTETPLDLSICLHAIQQRDLFIVPDASRDARFAQNALVAGGPGIRFYAGAPLVTPEGAVIGTLCVVDRVPRTLTPTQEEALRVLGRQVVSQLELRRQTRGLMESEDMFAKAFRYSPDGVTIVRMADHTIIKANEMICRILGSTMEDIIGRPSGKFSRWLNEAERAAFLRTLEETGECLDFEMTLQGTDGRPIRLNSSSRLLTINGEPCILSVMRDVTVERRTEEALAASELRYRRLFESAKDGILILDAETGMVVDVNPFMVSLLGFSHEELLGKMIWELGVFKDVFANIEKFAELREKEYVRYESLPLETREGRHVAVEFVSNVYLVNGAKVVQCNVRDMTDRRRIEARYRRLVESNAQGVIFWKTDGAITGANDAFLQLVGYTREDLDAGRMNWIAMTPPEFADLDRRALEEITAKGIFPPFEKEYLRKDGSRVPLLIGAAVFDDSPAEGVCFVLDLTERKKLEALFLRAQRMESIGTLAGGIAHDLNNVLSPIMLSLELLQMKFTDPDSQELLAIIQTSAQRGADLVKQVLSFARGVEGRRMEVQVRHIIQEIEKIANDTFLKHIRVLTIIPHDLWTVVGDPTQLHQVLMNLCVNARDAMPDGGTLTISAENLTLDAQYAGMSINPEARPGPYVFLQVRDTGTGMPAGMIDKIFDPFFTTKEVGKGTGLGLSTTLGIVQSHSGFIRVYSEVGKGTIFKVYLPAQTEGAGAAAAVEAATELPRGHDELILVVDDEVTVRQITQRTLETFGYRVILAANGVEAVALYAARRAEIAAVLTDMMMPVMDGQATIRILREMNPAVRVIAASGLGANDQVAQAISLGVKHFLPKPYTAETLLKVLHETLSP